MTDQIAAPTVAPSPGQQREQFGIEADLEKEAYGFRRDQRGLLGRLGEDGIAGGERGGDLAGEDREREVPRADAGENTAAMHFEAVGFADRAPFRVFEAR